MPDSAPPRMSLEEFLARGAAAVVGAAETGGLLLTKEGRPFMQLVPVSDDLTAVEEGIRQSLEDIAAGRLVAGEDLLTELERQFQAAFPVGREPG